MGVKMEELQNTELHTQEVHCLSNRFRLSEIGRVGGREFACRVYKLEQFINLLDEEKARDLAYKMLRSTCHPELLGYFLVWLDGMGFGMYTLGQVIANIGERPISAESVEMLALW
jgi:hypothetical protein